MWILVVLFLLLPLIPYQLMTDREIRNDPDYTMQDTNIEIAQFVSYTNAVRKKASLDKYNSGQYTVSELKDYASNPLLQFPPTAISGNCCLPGQSVSVRKIDDSILERTVTYRVAWITPRTVDWKKDLKYLNEKFFGVYDPSLATTEDVEGKNGKTTVTHYNIKTKGNWSEIDFDSCSGLSLSNKDALLFVIEQ